MANYKLKNEKKMPKYKFKNIRITSKKDVKRYNNEYFKRHIKFGFNLFKKKNLHFLGARNFKVVSKQCIWFNAFSYIYRFILATEDGKFEESIAVSKKEFYSTRLNKPYKVFGVVQNSDKPEYYKITKRTDEYGAIRETLRYARRVIFLFSVWMMIFAASFVILVYYLIYILSQRL